MRHSLSALALLCATGLSVPAIAKAPAEAGALPEGRLSDAVSPGAYRLDFTVDPAKERFTGRTEIDATLKRPSRFVWIHGRDLKVSKVTADLGARSIEGKYSEEDDSGVALLTFAEALPAGPIKLSFEYDASFGNNAAGMFHVKVGDDWYAWTQFESIDARAAFPSFDQPGFKTPFTVTIRTRPGQKAISNAPEAGLTQENGWDVHRFAPTLPLPTYLVALMTGPFVTAEGTVPPTPQRQTLLPLRIVSTKQNAAQLSYALENSKDIVRHLEAYFGQPFPYPKLDLITSPIMPGAMENAGADLFNDSIIVLDDKAPTTQKRTFGMVVAHELAHQWFGDLVTPAWWDDIWLNESFANWMGYRIGGEWEPRLNIAAGANAEAFTAMGTDALAAGRPIHQPIVRNAQIDAAFDQITYGKGGQVVAMVAGYMGDAKFREGVRQYMAAHKYGNATSAEFFGAMAKVAGDPRLLKAMQSFTDQQGVSLVTFSGGKGGKWTVTQSRYARLGTEPSATQWGVPLCLRATGSSARSCSLLTAKTGGVTVAGTGALMPNAGGTGYYRFELPRAEWDRLIAAAPELPGAEGLALEDSLAASYYAGRATPAQLVAASRMLARNSDSYVSGNAASALQGLYYRGMVGGAGAGGYRRLMTAILTPQVAALGFDPRAGAHAADDPEKAQRRAAAVKDLADEGRDPATRATLSAAAKAWLAGDAAALDAAYYNAAFLTYAQDGGLTAAKVLVERALSSEDPVLRPTLLGDAAGNGDPATAKWLLDEFDDKRLRRSEKLGLLQEIIATPETSDYAYGWLTAHLGELTSGSNGIFVASRLPGMLGGFCSTARAAEIARLAPRFAGKTGELGFQRALERVRACGRLREAQGAALNAELAKVN